MVMTVALLALLLPQTPKPLTAFAKVEFKPIDEMSGIVRSRRYDNTYWVHNDSGDSARFFAITGNGAVIAPTFRNRKEDSGAVVLDPGFKGVTVEVAQNVDWEDIAYDGDNLFLCDTGNNDNHRRDLGIYKVKEPNPTLTEATRPLTWMPVFYEDQAEFPPKERHFDCEAVFWLKGKLYFVTKHRFPDGRLPDASANLYRMDTQWSDKPNRLKKLDSIKTLGGWVTAADMSSDGKTLAVLCHAMQPGIWLFDSPKNGDQFFQGRKRYLPITGVQQCEAICWDGPDHLIITNEQREMFRVSVSEFVAK